MTQRELRLGLLAFLVLAFGLAANMLFFQNAQHVRLRAHVGTQADAIAADRARRLSLGAVETAATPSVATRPAPSGPGMSVLNPGTADRSPLTPGLAPPRGGEDESVETVRAIQRELQLKGYQPGAADGVPGLTTRAAIMAFEHDYGLPLTGEAHDRLLKAILFGASSSGAAKHAAVPPTAGAQTVIRTVQQTLSALGYAKGPVDGQIGPDTIRAIRAFEAQAGLPETGRISGTLLSRLAQAAATRSRTPRG